MADKRPTKSCVGFHPKTPSVWQGFPPRSQTLSHRIPDSARLPSQRAYESWQGHRCRTEVLRWRVRIESKTDAVWQGFQPRPVYDATKEKR